MYATTNDPNTPANDALPSLSTLDMPRFRRNLDAIYREHAANLLAIARTARRGHDASDAVQDAFLQVLERPPLDLRPRALLHALEAAVRVACERQRRTRRDEDAMKIALRKRNPV